MLLRGDAGKGKLPGNRLAVEGEAAAGERAGAERKNVGARAGLGQAFVIAGEHFKIREQVMRPQDGLGAAQMRVAGYDGGGIGVSALEQGVHQGMEQREDPADLSTQPQPRVERDLLVAAAAGMDLIGKAAGALLQLANDQRVNVFVGGAVEEARLLRFFKDRVEGRGQRRDLGGGKDADALQGAGEGLRAFDVGVDQKFVEVERAGESLEDFRRPGFETPAPELHRRATTACRFARRASAP